MFLMCNAVVNKPINCGLYINIWCFISDFRSLVVFSLLSCKPTLVRIILYSHKVKVQVNVPMCIAHDQCVSILCEQKCH